MDEEVKIFLTKHGLMRNSDYQNYYFCMGYYYAYSVDAFIQAEKIEDGEIFDEMEVGCIIQNMTAAYNAMDYVRERLGIVIEPFNPAETITFQNGIIREGKLEGNVEEAVNIAKKWVRRFLNRSEPVYWENPERVDKELLGDFFLYEAGIFILYLLDEEVNYGFLERRGKGVEE